MAPGVPLEVTETSKRTFTTSGKVALVTLARGDITLERRWRRWRRRRRLCPQGGFDGVQDVGEIDGVVECSCGRGSHCWGDASVRRGGERRHSICANTTATTATQEDAIFID